MMLQSVVNAHSTRYATMTDMAGEEKEHTVILIMLVMRAHANTLAINPRMRLCISHLLGLQIRYHTAKTLAGPQVDSVGTTHAGTVFFVCKG